MFVLIDLLPNTASIMKLSESYEGKILTENNTCVTDVFDFTFLRNS